MKMTLNSGVMQEELELDENHIVGIIHPDKIQSGPALTDDDLLNAIDNPIDSLSLEERVHASSSVAIIVDDATRPTPTKRILPLLLGKLKNIGVADRQISITIATGLHRKTTPQEKSAILGDSVISSFNIEDNDARDPQVTAYAGTTASGKEIYLNKRILSADMVITIGVVKSHAFAGFTGGAKSILPGVASQRTIHENHCYYNIEYPRGVLGSCEMSATRKEMEEAARIVDPFIINVVLGESNRIQFAASGDVVSAHRAAVNYFRKGALKTVRDKVDIAIVHGGLAGSISFYQGLFGCNVVKTTEKPILKKNGIVILFAECREGSGSKLLEEMMPKFNTPDEILQHLASNSVFDDQWAVQFLATFLRDIKIYLVSTGISAEVAEKLKIRLFNKAEDAMREAIAESSADYRIALIQNPDVLIVNLS